MSMKESHLWQRKASAEKQRKKMAKISMAYLAWRIMAKAKAWRQRNQ
jgi:hypothetical protein